MPFAFRFTYFTFLFRNIKKCRPQTSHVFLHKNALPYSSLTTDNLQHFIYFCHNINYTVPLQLHFYVSFFLYFPYFTYIVMLLGSENKINNLIRFSKRFPDFKGFITEVQTKDYQQVAKS